MPDTFGSITELRNVEKIQKLFQDCLECYIEMQKRVTEKQEKAFGKFCPPCCPNNVSQRFNSGSLFGFTERRDRGESWKFGSCLEHLLGYDSMIFCVRCHQCSGVHIPCLSHCLGVQNQCLG